jgi:acetoin utilization deacetylase AcuC-like enzyme
MTLIYHPRFLDHYQTPHHPESPERLVAINSKLEEEKLLTDVLEPMATTEEDLLRIHTKEHVDYIKAVGEGRIDLDTMSHEDTFEIAMLACGGAILAQEKSFFDRKPSIALLRPPGHHAGPDYCGGFCYFNNIALAAEHLLDKVKRVAILDIDVHHGNGTSDIFAKRNDVLYISTHQWGIFPGTGPSNYIGEEAGMGYTVNLAFPSKTGDTSYQAAWEEIIDPILNEYKPDGILMSIGGDAHYMDPLASLTLSSLGYLSIVDKIEGIAKKYCDDRFSIYLEGGYHTGALADIICGIQAKFNYIEPPIFFGEMYDLDVIGRDAIEATKEAHASYWKL